jgi:putative FmdB family regulatory protein
MPLIDFVCTKCGKEKEVLGKSSLYTRICECGEVMTRMVSRSNFELKGSGWAKDGYK